MRRCGSWLSLGVLPTRLKCRGEKQPSDVTFKLSELSSQPEDSYSPIATYQTLVQTVVDQAAYDALQNAWRGDSVSTSGTVTRNTSWGGTSGRRRSLLQSGGSDETKLPASAVGTWTNCSATCTYEVGWLEDVLQHSVWGPSGIAATAGLQRCTLCVHAGQLLM